MNKYTFSFQNFWTISAFGRDNSTITTKADNDQSDLVVEIWSFRKLIKPKNSEKKTSKRRSYKLIQSFFSSIVNELNKTVFFFFINITSF